MTILTQQFAANDEYRPPPRTYKRRPRFRIKRTSNGWVWLSKKKRALTKPAKTKSEAKRLAKAKLKAIKLAKKGRRMIKPVPTRRQTKVKRKAILKFLKRRV
jgi:hypothetical protein